MVCSLSYSPKKKTGKQNRRNPPSEVCVCTHVLSSIQIFLEVKLVLSDFALFDFWLGSWRGRFGNHTKDAFGLWEKHESKHCVEGRTTTSKIFAWNRSDSTTERKTPTSRFPVFLLLRGNRKAITKKCRPRPRTKTVTTHQPTKIFE